MFCRCKKMKNLSQIRPNSCFMNDLLHLTLVINLMFIQGVSQYLSQAISMVTVSSIKRLFQKFGNIGSQAYQVIYLLLQSIRAFKIHFQVLLQLTFIDQVGLDFTNVSNSFDNQVIVNRYNAYCSSAENPHQRRKHSSNQPGG